jgi:acylphosphatase
MATKRLHVIVEGRVQGVFFRAHTRDEAMRLGLVGWVRNRPDGSVEAEIEGESDDVDRMIDWLHEGSPHASVSHLRINERPVAGNEPAFVIHYH